MSHSDNRDTIRELKADLEDIAAHRDRREWNKAGGRPRFLKKYKKNRRRKVRYEGRHTIQRELQDS